jgi:hypothetical protein
MVENSKQQPTTPTASNQNYVMPSQMQDLAASMASISKLLMEVTNTLITLRREFRGEALYQDELGTSEWIQISKPSFVVMDQKTNKPVKVKAKMPWGEQKEIYVPNDEAIDEVLSMLKFVGINQISPIGVNTEDNYLDDLREFECKLAAVLALKQKGWGLDKELLPMMQMKIKTLIQDVRSMSIKGNTIKALQTTVQRVEQLIEGDRSKSKQGNGPY